MAVGPALLALPPSYAGLGRGSRYQKWRLAKAWPDWVLRSVSKATAYRLATCHSRRAAAPAQFVEPLSVPGDQGFLLGPRPLLELGFPMAGRLHGFKRLGVNKLDRPPTGCVPRASAGIVCLKAGNRVGRRADIVGAVCTTEDVEEECVQDGSVPGAKCPSTGRPSAAALRTLDAVTPVKPDGLPRVSPNGSGGAAWTHRVEAAGIEPASRDVSAPASTCIVAGLISPSKARSDTVQAQPVRPKSRPGNRTTPDQQARFSSPCGPSRARSRRRAT